MSSITRLTNNSDETDISSLISKDNIFSIPFFQRPYKWKPDRVKKIQEDILSLVDGTSEFHFLGAVIVHGRRTNPADPDVFEVIDGQQRLTTIYLLLCATVKVLWESNEIDEAVSIFQKYVAVTRNLRTMSNARLQSCKEDRPQLNYVIRDCMNNDQFKSSLGNFEFRPLPIAANTRDTGTLRNNYLSMVRFLKKEKDDNGIERVRDIYSCLLNKVTIVQIDIKDPASGPSIFDSLNSRQEPMTIGDLVRNGIFSRISNKEPDEIDSIDHEYWQPFYNGFEYNSKNYFDSFFFPYGLIQDPNLKKTEIYNSLQEQWVKLSDPKDIIGQLRVYQDPFMDLMCGTNNSNHSKIVAEKFSNLHRLGLPSSTLPFLMKISAACKQKEITEDQCISISEIIESFLVRRALCSIEPTGLHAVFKRLWRDMKDDLNGDSVKEKIKAHKTVMWPDDKEVINSIKTRQLAAAGITKYFLTEHDLSQAGDHPLESYTTEHIMPQRPRPGAWDHIKKETHERLVHTLANLIPLSGDMNRELSNGSYKNKRKKYLEESMYRSTRQLASEHEDWTENEINKRANTLASWALKRWPH